MGKNIAIPNINIANSLAGSNQLTAPFYPVWKLTRALKAAGWVYKGGSDGYTKETTGAAIADKWGQGIIYPGHVQLGSQTGAAATVGTISRNVVTINGLTGMTTDSVGRSLTLSGSTNPVTNGTFTIVAFNSSSSVNIINNNVPVSDSTSLTWSERVNGSGTITWSAPSFVREQTITGLTNIKEDYASHYILLRGASNSANNGVFRVIKILSATSLVISNSAGISETASGNWSCLDPIESPTTTALFTNIGPSGWICMQGPSTLKIPISTAVTGTFARGENVTQYETGAQGELVSYVYNTATSLTYLVVNPRLDGSGSGVHGWSTGASSIVGAVTGAVATTSSAAIPVEYVREIVIWRSSSVDNSFTVYSQCVDSVGESTHRFSSRISSAGCTATVAPGGGGTNNLFPAIGSYVIKGTGGTDSATSIFTTNVNQMSRIHFIAANVDYTSNVSADGTFLMIVGAHSSKMSGLNYGWGHQAIDGTENGDLDPYVWFNPTANSITNTNVSYGIPRLGGINTRDSTSVDSLSVVGLDNTYYIHAWIGRGVTDQDYPQMMQLFSYTGLGGSQPTETYYPINEPNLVLSDMSTYYTLRNPLIADSIQAVINSSSVQPYKKVRKGALRWITMAIGGQMGDTYDNRQLIQVSSMYGSFIVGPWDGISRIIQN